VRRALLWWFQAPADAHVSVNFSIDFGPARAYLEQLATQPGPKVTVQHLLTAAVARSLRRHPLANAQVVRNRIVLRPDVGVAMPVNLVGHPGGSRRELGVSLLPRADSLSLRELALQGGRSVKEEREGRPGNPLIRVITRLAEGVPLPLFFSAMDIFELARRLPGTSELVFRAVPATTLLSNVGAPFDQVPGMLFRGGALSPPTRLGHVGTVWGTSTVQDEVVAHQGQPTVRPMLPVLLLFDHRLLDGVAAGRLAQTFAGILADPAAEFGIEGQATAPSGNLR